MVVYLVRHGEALPKEIDAEQGLSERGKLNARRSAALLREIGAHVEWIQESGKRRATQTAEIMAAAVTPGRPPVQARGLDPMDPVEPVVERLGSLKSDSMLVGHLPFLSRLTSSLITGREEPDVVRFPPAGVACLARDLNRRWILLWMVVPEILQDSSTES